MPDDEQRYVRYGRTKSIQGRQLLKVQEAAAAAHIDTPEHTVNGLWYHQYATALRCISLFVDIAAWCHKFRVLALGLV